MRVHSLFNVLVLVSACIVTGGCGADASSSPQGSGAGGSGTAGSGGSATSGNGGAGGAVEECVNVVDAGFDLYVTGSAYDAYDGKRVRIATVAGESVGFGGATITAGAFELFLPATLIAYTSIGIFVDTNEDDVCGSDEPFFELTTGILDTDVTFSVTPDEVCNNQQGNWPAGCSPWYWTQPQFPCVVNGLIDMSEPLPCSSD